MLIIRKIINPLPFKIISSFSRFQTTSQPLRRLPDFYNLNISLYSNINKVKSFQQLFILHQNVKEEFTDKHLALASRMLMKFVLKSQVQSGKLSRKEGFWITQNRQQWVALLEHIFFSELEYLTKDQLVDYLHFISKSMQFRMNYNKMSKNLNYRYPPFRTELIERVTTPQMLKQYSIPQLTTILHMLIALKQRQNSFINIVEQLTHKLQTLPFCTCFHLILLNNHIQLLLKNQLQPPITSKINQLLNIMRKVAQEQLPIVIEYIDIVTVVQLYNFIGGQNKLLGNMLITRAITLLPQVTKIKQKSSFLKSQLEIFIKSLDDLPKETTDIKNLKQTLINYKKVLPSAKPFRDETCP